MEISNGVVLTATGPVGCGKTAVLEVVRLLLASNGVSVAYADPVAAAAELPPAEPMAALVEMFASVSLREAHLAGLGAVRLAAADALRDLEARECENEAMTDAVVEDATANRNAERWRRRAVAARTIVAGEPFAAGLLKVGAAALIASLSATYGAIDEDRAEEAKAAMARAMGAAVAAMCGL